MIILASASPRRRELLGRICDFEVRPSDCDEKCDKTDPAQYVTELSQRKAHATRAENGDTVIAADTSVFLDGEMLNKPRDKADAKRMLKALSGRIHSVYTGVTVISNGRSVSFCEKTDVEFYGLSSELISEYAESGEPLDKAGAYGIQGKGCVLVKRIDGDYFNVMGLPVARLYRELKNIGAIK